MYNALSGMELTPEMCFRSRHLLSLSESVAWDLP